MRLCLVILSALLSVPAGSSSLVSSQADHIIIEKSTHTITIYDHASILGKYKVALGRGGVGPKVQQGDHKTPEGQYTVDSRNAHSAFHLALHLSYPNAQDRARAAQSNLNPGGSIEIHGLPPRFAWLGRLANSVDWTDGCIAVTDKEIEEIWRIVPNGTRVDILP
jgi:murein L,D-transpeptidase YafK